MSSESLLPSCGGMFECCSGKDPNEFFLLSWDYFKWKDKMKHQMTRRKILSIIMGTGLVLSVPGGRQEAKAHSGKIVNLKELEDGHIVQSIAYCRGTYTVTTLTGKNHIFPEFNLRMKTDSGPNGPNPGKPVLIRSGMRGIAPF